MPELEALARRFVEAAQRGDAEAVELARELAWAVGEALEPTNRLVAAVLAGGPFTVRRALDLVRVVIPTNSDGSAGVAQHEG